MQEFGKPLPREAVTDKCNRGHHLSQIQKHLGDSRDSIGRITNIGHQIPMMERKVNVEHVHQTVIVEHARRIVESVRQIVKHVHRIVEHDRLSEIATGIETETETATGIEIETGIVSVKKSVNVNAKKNANVNVKEILIEIATGRRNKKKIGMSE